MIRITVRSSTSEVYYYGRSVKIVGSLLTVDGHALARKWDAVDSPWIQHGTGQVIEAITIEEKVL